MSLRSAAYIAFAVFMFLFTSAGAFATEDKPAVEDKPMYKAGEVIIYEKDFLKELEKSPVNSSDEKMRVLNEIVRREILYREAIKQGYDKNLGSKDKPSDPEALKSQIIKAFIDGTFAKEVVVIEEETMKYYDRHKKTSYELPPRYKAMLIHIYKFDRSYKDITETARIEAGTIRERLIKGEHPLDVWSSYQDHEVFNISRTFEITISENNKLPKEMLEALPTYKEGSVSVVTESKDAFLVMKVLEVLPPLSPKVSFEDAKASIHEKLFKQKVEQKVAKFLNDYISKNNGQLINREFLKK